MAGNIIPAIATTNAIIAGLIVLLGMKVLAGNGTECKTTYLSYGNERRLLHNESLVLPSVECVVCTTAYRTALVDAEHCTLGAFVERVIAHFGLDGDVTVMRKDG